MKVGSVSVGKIVWVNEKSSKGEIFEHSYYAKIIEKRRMGKVLVKDMWRGWGWDKSLKKYVGCAVKKKSDGSLDRFLGQVCIGDGWLGWESGENFHYGELKEVHCSMLDVYDNTEPVI